jgi:hypothetical protein
MEIYDGDRFVFFRRERLEEVCREMTGGFTRPAIVRIQELPRAECCGYASVDPDGNTYIESLPGALWGFRLKPVYTRPSRENPAQHYVSGKSYPGRHHAGLVRQGGSSGEQHQRDHQPARKGGGGFFRL